MSDSLIDARHRFALNGASRSFVRQEKQASAEDIENKWAERLQRRNEEAKGLRQALESIPRLDVADRKVIVRNLGRAIERRHKENPKQFCAQLFRHLFGEDGGLSKEKKRKRYIRFDGEPLSDHGPGDEYAANGPEFLRLIEGLADLLDPQIPAAQSRSQLLLNICDGTSFYGHTRPRLIQGQNHFQVFAAKMDAVIDRIARETDLIEYLAEVQHYDINIHPNTHDEFTEQERSTLHVQFPPIKSFEHCPGEHSSSRLRLNVFDIRTEEPSYLYPSIRLARVYLPRPILCLPASVPTALLDEIRSRPLTENELAEALTEIEGRHASAEDREKFATYCWRNNRESEIWSQALREAGFDPGKVNWSSFEDDIDGEALNGAKWHTFWKTFNINLHVVADEEPEALRFGLAIRGGMNSWWTDNLKELARPSDDDAPGSDINCTLTDPGFAVPWLPIGDRSFVCRGYTIAHPWEGDFESDLIDTDEHYKEPLPPQWDCLAEKPLHPLLTKETWEILTMPMADWRAPTSSFGCDYRDSNITSRLRPLFDAPNGWTPAPDGSIASAILRSLAYGVGEERIDAKIISSINNRVGCLGDMKEKLSRQFEEALSQHGYID